VILSTKKNSKGDIDVGFVVKFVVFFFKNIDSRSAFVLEFWRVFLFEGLKMSLGTCVSESSY
jgi:hypothetical protein